jgi:hypothetical protein
MGQYHKLVNLDKKEQVISYALGLGAKQYEQTGMPGSMSDALYLLLMSSPASGGGDWENFPELSGRWVGDRVAVLGDYTQENAIPDYENASDLYRVSAEWLDISNQVALALGKIFGFEIDTAQEGWRDRKELVGHWFNS